MRTENPRPFKPTFISPQAAFESAIKAGILSRDPDHSYYAGHYMYMYTSEGVHSFKHQDTREYVQSFA